MKQNNGEVEEEIIKDHNFIISQNRILFVPKITNAEIKSGGKYCSGVDYATNDTVQILDKDYGKSAELMRALLETSSPTPLRKKAVIVVILGFVVLGVGIAIFSIFPEDKKIETEIEIQEDISILPVVVAPVVPVPVVPVVPENTENLKFQFEIEKLQIENMRIIEQKNQLTHENFALINEISILEEKSLIFEKEPIDLKQEAFLLFLGMKVYEGCQKTEREGFKNKCKNLYFSYVKNVE